MQRQQAKGELPDLLSIDGKVIANKLAIIVSLVDARDSSPVAQAAASGNGQEQILTKSSSKVYLKLLLKGRLSAAMLFAPTTPLQISQYYAEPRSCSGEKPK